jgi:F-type H+-transporting ATPase subunit b
MRIDWWTLGLQTVNVLVLVWLLSRFLFKPVANIIAERQEAAATILRDAAAAREAAEHAHRQAADAAAAFDAQRSRRLSEVSAEADALKASLLAAARGEADTLRADAARALDAMRRDAAKADAARAAEFALDIAARLLSRLPPDAQVRGFIEPLAAAVRALPDDTRRSLAAHGESIRIVAPRTLSDPERQRCTAALAAALQREIAIQVEVDPTLIAGLELTAAHVIVCNSFRHDLDTLKADLLSHDDKR